MMVQYADGGGIDDELFKSPGPSWGKWGYGRWGWGYYNDPGDMRAEPLDFNLVAAALDVAPAFAQNRNFTLIGGAGIAGTPQYKGYRILNSIDAYYGKNRAQKTFVNLAMRNSILPDSGDGGAMAAHLTAKGLSVTNAGSPELILTSLANSKVDVITIGSHGGPGFFDMEGGTFSFSSTAASSDFWQKLKANLNPGATIIILGCNFGGDEDGVADMTKIAGITGATIVAPTGQYVALIGMDNKMTGTADILKTGNTPAGEPGYIVVPPP